MKSSFTKYPGSIIDLKVDLTLEEFKKYWEPAFEEALANINLKGFRPGQAPREMAKRYVDEEKVFEKAANDAVRFSLNEIIQDNSWTVIDKPQVSIISDDPEKSFRDLGASKGFTYEAKLIIFPDIELGDYKKIAHKWVEKSAEEIKRIEVTDEELADSLEWLRKSRAKSTNELPELNDEFAQFLGHGFKNLADLKQSVKEGLAQEKQERAREKARIGIIDELIGVSKIDIPQVMIDRTKEQIIKELGAQALADESEDQQKKIMEAAGKRVAAQLVIYRIAQLENLNPTEEEVREEMARRDQSQKLDSSRFYDYIYDVLRNKKVLEFLSPFAPEGASEGQGKTIK